MSAALTLAGVTAIVVGAVLLVLVQRPKVEITRKPDRRERW